MDQALKEDPTILCQLKALRPLTEDMKGESQNTPQAQEIGWAGLQLEKNPVQDLELALKELEPAPMIDLEREGSTAPPKGEGSMAPPKDPTEPKPKKAPAGMTPATNAMPKIQDDTKRAFSLARRRIIS